MIKILMLGLLLSQSLVALPKPIKTLLELREYTTETAIKVSTARVVLVDYPLIRRDFPELSSAKQKDIDAWLLKYSGFVAKTQVEQGLKENTNTKIIVSDQEMTAYRPPKYGRALVIKTESGLLDIKGAGAISPKIGGHSNGLGVLSEMIREFMFEKLVHEILSNEQEGDTIQSYAVIDLGFSANVLGKGMLPAAQILRQAHVREIHQQRDSEWVLEKILRTYGLTSGWYTGGPYLTMNIQYSLERALVDFGCYFVTNKFTEPLVYYGYDYNKVPALVVNDPKGPEAVQPDPKKCVLLKKWNFHTYDPQFSNPFLAARSPKMLAKKRRWLANYIKKALKEQRVFWQTTKAQLTHEKPTGEDERPAKKSRGEN